MIQGFDNRFHEKSGKNLYYRRNIGDISVEEQYLSDNVAHAVTRL